MLRVILQANFLEVVKTIKVVLIVVKIKAVLEENKELKVVQEEIVMLQIS